MFIYALLINIRINTFFTGAYILKLIATLATFFYIRITYIIKNKQLVNNA